MKTGSVRVAIRGRVQGVGFRAWVEYTALLRGLDGWVRNRRDGSVEALFVGPVGDVRTMIEACRRGPPGARVEALSEQEAKPDALDLRYSGEAFSVLPTE
jgi:acylphosphatase